jgi:starch synthase (maltosyl-transferring)
VKTEEGRLRVTIDGVSPEIDGGRFPAKWCVGDQVAVGANIFADGHDVLGARISYRHEAELQWSEAALELVVNDRWQGTFPVTRLGTYLFTVDAWVDHFGSWRRDLEKKFKAGMDIAVDLLAGVAFVEQALKRAEGDEANDLRKVAETLASTNPIPTAAKVAAALSPHIADLVERHADRSHVTRYDREVRVTVDPELARFGAWFEAFPRSMAREAGRQGTFADCERWLRYIATLGFDVLYLPPIHPIGHSFRKGPNNSLVCGPDDPGSPWAVGNEGGGHKSIDPALGTLKKFQELVGKARELQVEIALDIAFQCSPDHPYVWEHPDWFKKRADGSIQYAENPPKKYQDIYPFDFECDDWMALWEELKSIFEFWIEQGVRVFRVDNPHTKPFRFWAWCIRELKKEHPELIFLSEAFTRPKVMYHLAKVGFTQSYNYFPWRNTKYELTQYLTELTQTEVREYFRPALWPNTPDILTQYLQFGGPAAFMSRLVLAATLSATYGLYAPPFLTGEAKAREPGSEEYLNSEKYEIRHWELEPPGRVAELAAKINRIRRDNPALQRNFNLRFHEIDNDQLIAYSKSTESMDDIVLTIVNLDPHHTQRGWVTLPLEEWGLGRQNSYQVHDLLTDSRFLWSGSRNYVELDPTFVPAHILRLRRYVRTEHDFDYFM